MHISGGTYQHTVVDVDGYQRDRRVILEEWDDRMVMLGPWDGRIDDVSRWLDERWGIVPRDCDGGPPAPDPDCLPVERRHADRDWALLDCDGPG